MKHLFTIIIAGFAIISDVSAEKPVNVENSAGNTMKDGNEMLASPEFKRDLTREFNVSSMPALTIKNEFGNINIKEGSDDKIIFRITITGKGKNSNLAKEYAQTANVDFIQNGSSITAKTVLKKLDCKNCGRNIDYEVTVPRKIKLTLDNKFGNINLNNMSETVEVQISFGKLYANILSDANIKVQHGGFTINKCENITISSDFSNNKVGEAGSVSGRVSHGGIDFEELGGAELKLGFSNVNIRNLKKSFVANDFSHGSLIINNIDYDFSEIKINANFAKIRVLFNENHSFKAALYCNFGNIRTGKVVFYEKTLDKRDAFVGVAGRTKEPSSIVDISNSHGNINLE